MATRTRRPARRAKAPRITHDQRRNLHGIGAIVAALLSIPLLLIPQGSVLTDWLGVGGDALLVAGLLLVGVRLLLGHGHASIWGVGMAIPGVVGLVGLASTGWAGQIGAGLADYTAAHVGPWWAALALLGLTVAGLVLAVDLDVPTVSRAVWARLRGWLGSERVGNWLRGTETEDEPESPIVTAEPVSTASRKHAGDMPPWLRGPLEDAKANPPQPMLPLEDDRGTSLSVAVVDAPRRHRTTPDIRILDDAPVDTGKMRDRDRAVGELLVSSLTLLNAPATITEINGGPGATQYVMRATPGVTARKYAGTQTDLALALGSAVRVQAPIPGQAAIGIEVAHADRQIVTLRSVLQSPEFVRIAHHSHVALGIGADTSGRPVIADLARMPHLLIGGTTGSGKSTLVRALMASLLLQSSPAQVRLVMIDPKRVEFTPYARRGGIPHLWRPVVTEPEEAVGVLTSLVEEMEDRYRMLAAASVEDLDGYNAVADPLPRIVVVIDELASLMLTVGKEVETLLCRLGAEGRAAGVHLVVATQSPRSDVITGLLKANLPSAIGLRVTSVTESRIVLNEKGAETLSGPGDLLLKLMDDGTARRLQGALITSKELDRVLTHWTG
jgi:DNA segregation ATPase FtsK/SpoIIIE-like protein